MRYNQLVEGMRYGQKQKNEILSSLDDFGFGIEIEMNSRSMVPSQEDIDDDNFSSEFIEVMQRYIVENPDTNLPHDSVNNIGTLSVIQEWMRKQYHENDYIDSTLHDSVANNLRVARDLFNLINETKSNISTDNDATSKALINSFETVTELLADFDESGHTDRSNFSPAIAYIICQQVADNEDEVVDIGDLEAVGSSMYYVTDRLYKLRDSHEDMEGLKEGSDEDIAMAMEDFILDEKSERFITSYTNLVESLNNAGFAFSEDMDADINIDGLIDDVVAFAMEHDASIEDIIISVFDLHIDNATNFEDLVEEIIESNPSGMYYELQDALDDLDDKIDSDSMHDILADMDLSFQYNIEDESDGQVEIITVTPHKGKEIVQAFDEAYHIISELSSDHGMYTAGNSGLHISISYMDGAYHFDPIKFTVLSNMLNMVDDEAHVRGYVQSIFSFVERNVEYIARQITDSVIENSTTPDLGNFIMEYVRDSLSDNNPWKHGSPKFKSINFEHYHSQNGRVELRVFGGEGFENKKEEYFDEMIRAMYTLKISTTNDSGTAYMDKEFKKMMFRIADKYFNQKYKMSISDYQDTVKLNLRILDKLKISVSDDISDIAAGLFSDAAEQKINIKELDRLATLAEHLPSGPMIDILHKPFVADALKAIYIIKRKLK